MRFDTDNLRARNLKVIALRNLGRDPEADALLGETRALDPLDWWARLLHGADLGCDAATALDIAHDYARAGQWDDSIRVLEQVTTETGDLPDRSLGVLPMVQYTMGWLMQLRGDFEAALQAFDAAAEL